MSELKTIVDSLNNYINTHGQIQRSTFIKTWHDHTNQQWIEVFKDVLDLEQTSGVDLSPWLRADLEKLVELILKHGDLHPNILNPHPNDTARLQKALTHFDATNSVKSVFWKTMMNLREYYCKVNDIDLPNDYNSRGKLNSVSHQDTFNNLFERTQ